MEKFLEKAERFSDGGDPEESLNNMRKFTEVAVKELGGKFDCLVDGKHSFKVTIQNLQNHLPRRLFYYIEHLHRMGNYGSHFQEDGVDPSKEDTVYCVYAGKEVYRWIFPPVDPIEQTAVFIENAYESVDCPSCDRKKGVRCKSLFPHAKSAEDWEGEHDNIHKERTAEYRNYRRDFQKHYNTTIADAMHEMVKDRGYKKDEKIKEIVAWFSKKYPAYRKNAVNSHSSMMTTNLETRYSHPSSKNGDEKFNLFFKDGGTLRLYDSEKDPTPLRFGRNLS